ncbi:FAD/NAD(P)-binding domain-containing protein [Heliocybe sulcata]|uniref:FAD/NAD(P)-binding domain-containing protein n=1 Tax=Heliocybe sulcata TaxID=5364 RepID=A0A5C3MPB2_9AGAM|nr:FAD/NAD(P)-binding domain-containing protein [Heliocybe sulcata]
MSVSDFPGAIEISTTLPRALADKALKYTCYGIAWQRLVPLRPSGFTSRSAFPAVQASTVVQASKARMMLEARKPKLTPSKASLALDFVVIGDGIGGLASAIALSRVGHNVVVLEGADGSDVEAGGSRVPPNMSKLLLDWGLKDELDIIAERTQTKALSLGAKVRHDALVVEVLPDSGDGKPVVVLQAGEVLKPDVLIGAEGRNSKIREEVLHMQDHQTPTGMVFVSSSLRREEMLKHPEFEMITATFSSDASQQIILKYTSEITLPLEKRVLLLRTHAQRRLVSDRDVTVHLWTPDDRTLAEREREGYWESISKERVAKLVGDANPTMKRFVELCDGALRVNSMENADFPEWIHPTAPIVLTGDAAHPFSAGSLFQDSMAVEDAACLGQLFSYITGREQVRFFLSAFQDIRQARLQSVRKSEAFMFRQHFTRQVAGADTVNSVEFARLCMALPPEGTLANSSVGDAMLEVFAYEAEEEANDWWVQWGLLHERSRGESESSELAVPTSGLPPVCNSNVPIESVVPVTAEPVAYLVLRAGSSKSQTGYPYINTALKPSGRYEKIYHLQGMANIEALEKTGTPWVYNPAAFKTTGWMHLPPQSCV